jgi:hypothetical protein
MRRRDRYRVLREFPDQLRSQFRHRQNIPSDVVDVFLGNGTLADRLLREQESEMQLGRPALQYPYVKRKIRVLSSVDLAFNRHLWWVEMLASGNNKSPGLIRGLGVWLQKLLDEGLDFSFQLANSLPPNATRPSAIRSFTNSGPVCYNP